MVDAGDSPSHRLDDATRDTLLLQHRSTVRPTVPEVAYRLPATEQLRDEVVDVLATTVTSSALEALKDDPQLAEWTRHGLGLHKSRQSEVCLFCQQPLPVGRLAALEGHFSTEYERFVRLVGDLIGRLKAIAKQASEVRPPDRAVLYADMTAEYDAAELTLGQVLEKVRGLIDSLVRALEEKSGQPFRRLDLDATIPELDKEIVGRLNEVIRPPQPSVR